MSRNAPARVLLVSLWALGACVLGDEGEEASPYESAYFGELSSQGVADGMTPVTILVHGELGDTLTLSARSARFVGSVGEGAVDEKTIQLADADGEGRGVAEVQLVSTSPGLATLSFKLAPVAESLELLFEPVQLMLNAPMPVELRPGAVTHRVCVYANTSRGTLALKTEGGLLVPELADITASSTSTQCQGEGETWPGAAHFEWTSTDAIGELELSYQGAGDTVLMAQQAQLRGEIFPGYEVLVRSSEITETWASMEVLLAYRETLSLPSQMATSVPLGDLRSVPSGLELVGSSTGGESTIPETDSEGWVTLYFKKPTIETELSVFATPMGGGTVFLGDIAVPEPDTESDPAPE